MSYKISTSLAVVLAAFIVAGFVYSQSFVQIDPGKTWAVIIGVSNYASSDVPSLRYAAADAQAFAQFLRSPRGGALSPDKVQLLVDGGATAFAVRTALGFLGRKVQEDDVVYIFIAGHGDVTPEDLSYFIPADGVAANVYATSINFDELKALVEKNLLKTKF